MTSVKPPTVRFSGYKINQDGQPELYLPGYQHARKIQAEIKTSPNAGPILQDMALDQDGYWRTRAAGPNKPLAPGMDYRFRIEANAPKRLTANMADSGESIPLRKVNDAWEYTLAKPRTVDATVKIASDSQTELTLEKIYPPERPKAKENVDPKKPPQRKTEPHPLTKTLDGWTFTQSRQDPAGTTYRLSVPKNALLPLDFVEVVDRQKDGSFNHIAGHQANTPQKSVVIADIYADSILTREQVQHLDQQERAKRGWQFDGERLPVLPLRTHFNKLNRVTLDAKADAKTDPKAGNLPGNQGFEDGLNQLIPALKDKGFTSILFKPFFGGDNLSSHRYWTADPYELNDTFRNKAAFQNSLDLMLKSGMKVFADGAFVNQGLNGTQTLANLKHGTTSNFWKNWFQFGGNDKTDDPKHYPSIAYEKYELGVLPTHRASTGEQQLNRDAFAVRFINDPTGKDALGQDYDANKPTFMELYDPRLEDAQGKPRPLAMTREEARKNKTATALDLKSSRSSVQKYRFPVDPKELKQKKANGDSYLEWKHFRLTTPNVDNSANKWDGQVDVALLNTRSPEVVNYLKGAVNYWSRMVMNHYTDSVAQKLKVAETRLKAAGKAQPTYHELLNEVTLGAQDDPVKHPHKILPPVTHPVDRIDADTANRYAEAKPDYTAEQAGQRFASTLLKDVPLNTVHLPILFKANLSDAQFLKTLNHERGKFGAFMENQFFGSLSKIPALGGVFRWLGDLVVPPRLDKALGREMQRIFDELSEGGGAAEKLRHREVQAIVADKIGEKLYIALLTGTSLAKADALANDPQALEAALYNHIPPSLMAASPQEASRRLPALFRKQFKAMNQTGPNGEKALKVQVREEMERLTQGLDPKLVSLASNVLKQREFGLNWRIDAAKDVADMDGVRNAESDQKAREKFKQEIAYLNEFWGKNLGDAMRSVFPKASVIAELTDFGSLAKDNQLGTEAKKSLFDDNTFTSTPNMDYLYSPPHQLIHYAQRPDEFGASQTTPSQFMNAQVKPMTQGVPLHAQRQYQNLTSSHDYSTSSHALMVNPELFNMDLNRKVGLKESFDVATYELESMACFEPERKALAQAGFQKGYFSVDPLPQALQSLRDWTLNSRGIVSDQLKHINPGLAHFYDSQLKKSYTSDTCPDNQKHLNIPTPADVKARFVDGLFDAKVLHSKLKPGNDSLGESLGATDAGKDLKALADLKLKREALDALQAQLSARMKEPSSAKAMRAIINNAVVDLSRQRGQFVNQAGVQDAIWAGLNEAIADWQEHFGYQPLDVALNHVFEKAEAKLPAVLKTQRASIEKLKVDLYNTAMKPVLQKQERVFGIQNALPGNPSVYLPDLFAQGGSEWTKNTYGQNRQIIRVDKLEKSTGNQDFQQYLDRVGKLFKSRTDLTVLQDGFVHPLPADDENGILPILRDNGQDQAIVLVDTGKPNATSQPIALLDHKAREQYSNVEGQWGQSRQIPGGLRLSSPYIRVGAVYEDVLNHNERFVVDRNHRLVPQKWNARFEILPNRVLKRVSG